MRTEACECLRKVLRHVDTGRASCLRHGLHAMKEAGLLQVSHHPFPGAPRPLTPREITEQRAALRTVPHTTKRARLKDEARRRR